MPIFTEKKESLFNYHQPSIINKISTKIQDLYYNIYYWFSDKYNVINNLIEYRKIVCGFSESDNLTILKMMDFQVKLLQERILKETLCSISEFRINGNVELFEKTERLRFLLNNVIEDNYYDRFGGYSMKFDCDVVINDDGEFDINDKTSLEQYEMNDKITEEIENNTKKEWTEMMSLFSDVMLNLIKYK